MIQTHTTAGDVILGSTCILLAALIFAFCWAETTDLYSPNNTGN